MGTALRKGPTPSDLIVPAAKKGIRNASHSNTLFKADLQRLGFSTAAYKTHYETRSAFRSLVLARRPDLERVLDLLTHPAPKKAADYYRRVQLLWPTMCEAVQSVVIAPKPTEAANEPSAGSEMGGTAGGTEVIQLPLNNEKAPGSPGLLRLHRWRAIQDSKPGIPVPEPALSR